MPADITFMGHSAFLFSDGQYTLAVDPFLTGNPAASHKAEDLVCTHVALTHGHADHFGDTVAIAKRNNAPVFAAFEITEYLDEQGVKGCEPGNPGGRIAAPFGSVAFTQAFHSSSYEGPLLSDTLHCLWVVVLALEDFYGVTWAVGTQQKGDQGHDEEQDWRPCQTSYNVGPHRSPRSLVGQADESESGHY